VLYTVCRMWLLFVFLVREIVKLICLCDTVIVCDEGYLKSVRVYGDY